MNVRELRKLLFKYPDSMEIVNERYSDLEIVSADDITFIEGVEKDGWVMRAHPTMSPENKAQSKIYLQIKGN